MSVLNETIDGEFTCEKHGKFTGSILRYSIDGFTSKGITPMCPKCYGEAEALRQHEAYKNRKAEDEKKYKAMNIPPEYHDASFDNFDAYNSELAGHLAVCRKFVENPRGKLCLLGNNGNGKTHLAAAIIKQTGGAMYCAYEIGMLLRDSYTNSGERERLVFQRMCETPVLVIDEVEKIIDTKAKRDWLAYVVSKRHDHRRPIVFISNCHTKQSCQAAQKPCPLCFESNLPNSVISRIVENGVILNFTSADYRIQLRRRNADGRAA